MFELKKYRGEELCVITLKSDAKFEEELTCALKNYMMNLVNFDPTRESLKVCTLMSSFCPKCIMLGLKKSRRVMHHYTEDGYKF